MRPLNLPIRAAQREALVALTTVALMAGGLGESRSQPAGSNAAPAAASVELAPDQLHAIKLGPVGTHLFRVQREAVGAVDFDEDRSVQVFPAYPGKLLKTFAELGDEVQLGQTLYTIDSPDLVQAESTLIGAAAAVEVTRQVLARAQALYGTNGVSKAELEQDVAAEKTAEGAVKSAREAVRIFGKTEAEVDQLVATGKLDPSMNVLSPLTGLVTAKCAPPGCWVQPGGPPAPYAVADPTVKWLLAFVPESDSPLIQVGQPIQASMMALSGRVFAGKITRRGAAIDPNARRVTVRCELPDPKNELIPGMLATCVIRLHDPVEATALPASGVVREGDGTYSAWVTTDRRHFLQRTIQPGMREDGEVQILEGLHPGEQVVTEGAVFLSNILFAPPTD